MSNFLWPQAPLSLDYSPPGSFVLGILQARILQWVASPSPGDSPSQGWNLGLLPCVQILYCLSSKGSPYTNLNVNQNTIPEMWNFLVGSLRKIQTENCSCLYSSSISCAFWIKLTTCVCWGGGLVPSDSLEQYGLQPVRLLCPWGFSKQEYWNGLPCPLPADLPNPGIKPRSPTL